MKICPTLVPVVAVALLRGDGHVLLQQRRTGASHGGLWEFPGGKIEPGEVPQTAAIREIWEELGVTVDPARLVAVGFAADEIAPPAPRAPHVILLYMCCDWAGIPAPHAAEQLGWFAPESLAALAMPPLDYPLAAALLTAIRAGGDDAGQ